MTAGSDVSGTRRLRARSADNDIGTTQVSGHSGQIRVEVHTAAKFGSKSPLRVDFNPNLAEGRVGGGPLARWHR